MTGAGWRRILACAIADKARAISDFQVMGDQRELFGPVASVPSAWRTLTEIADGGTRTAKKILAGRRWYRDAWCSEARAACGRCGTASLGTSSSRSCTGGLGSEQLQGT